MIATLLNPKFSDAPEQLSLVQEAARTLSLEARVFNASSESEIEPAFAAIAGQQSDALFVGADPFLSSRQDLIIATFA